MTREELLAVVRAKATDLLNVKGMSHLRMVDGIMGALKTGAIAGEGIAVVSSLEDDGTITVEIVSKTTLYLPVEHDGEIDF